MKILFVASEAVPFCKTGGLADVAGELPVALAKLGQDVSVVLPKYSSINAKYVKEFKYLGNFYVEMLGHSEYVGVFKYIDKGVTFFFIDNEKYFNRPNLYGYDDDAIRFGFFDCAVVRMIQQLKLHFDIIHLHDWQAGMVAPLIRENFLWDDLFKNTKIMMSIHNAAYQGLCDKNYLYNIFHISMDQYNNGKTRFKDALCFLKSGIFYADRVFTVSEQYMKELQNGENAYGLELLLSYRKNDFFGVLNGVDYETYNPSNDPLIAKNFTKYDVNKILNKGALQKQFNLVEGNDIPLLVMITRFTFQKGIDLVLANVDYIVSQGAELVVLGSGESQYEAAFEAFHSKYPDKVGIYRGYNDELAHKIYAGGDILLMPSAFEPCGISQLIGMRYGTIPVARNVGGLHDSIIDYNKSITQGDGFLFEHYDAQGLRYGISSALLRYKSLVKWRGIVKNAMAQDFSWERSAKKYLELYESSPLKG
ncbi:MAG: glycogen synthase [Bacilli bacterium]|jgi:starch synthase|nr:glycogen synthase [Bacilli bacterium]MDD4065612.1 glycogen synthase [Bacilli bacterium]